MKPITLEDIYRTEPKLPQAIGQGDYLWIPRTCCAYVVADLGPPGCSSINLADGDYHHEAVPVEDPCAFTREEAGRMVSNFSTEYLGHGVEGLRAALAKLEAAD
jgi:hypothetical protein